MLKRSHAFNLLLAVLLVCALVALYEIFLA
jgi:hypothetical protein